MSPGVRHARAALFASLVAVAGCGRARAVGAAVAPGAEGPRPRPRRSACSPTGPEAGAFREPPPRPLRRCFEDLPAWADAPSRRCWIAPPTLRRDDYDGALACAEEAARQAPRSVEAHHDRAVALIQLARFDEARDALSLALSLAPDDSETLELAADFYINHLPPSADRAALGLEYARRGAGTSAAPRSRPGRAWRCWRGRR